MSRRKRNNLLKHWFKEVAGFNRSRKEKCPFCKNKIVAGVSYYRHVERCSEIAELRARTYNEDVIVQDDGKECIICLDNMYPGQTVARLQCLCVYHKTCIDLWLDKKTYCPAHPT